MGNINYAEGHYSEAIKMYQMALDHIPQEKKNIGFKVLRNIGNALVNIGKYRNEILILKLPRVPIHTTKLSSIHCYVMLYLETRKKLSDVLPKLCHCS